MEITKWMYEIKRKIGIKIKRFLLKTYKISDLGGAYMCIDIDACDQWLRDYSGYIDSALKKICGIIVEKRDVGTSLMISSLKNSNDRFFRTGYYKIAIMPHVVYPYGPSPKFFRQQIVDELSIIVYKFPGAKFLIDDFQDAIHIPPFYKVSTCDEIKMMMGSVRPYYWSNPLLFDAWYELAQNLDDLFEPENARLWLNKPNFEFFGETPLEFIKKRPRGLLIVVDKLRNIGR